MELFGRDTAASGAAQHFDPTYSRQQGKIAEKNSSSQLQNPVAKPVAAQGSNARKTALPEAIRKRLLAEVRFDGQASPSQVLVAYSNQVVAIVTGTKHSCWQPLGILGLGQGFSHEQQRNGSVQSLGCSR